jgi:hypothetical protein
MTLTSDSTLGPGERKADVAEKMKIIKTTRGVCVRNNAESGEVTDADAGEVHRVPANIANLLIGDGSAVESTAEELEAFVAAKAKKDKKAAAAEK